MKGAARNLSCTPLLLASFVKGFPFSLSHMGRYTGMQKGSLHFGRDDVAETALFQHILYTRRGLYIPRYRHFERSREILLALRRFLLLPQKVSPFPLSHIGRYTGMQEGSLHFGRDDGTRIAIYKHIRCTLRGIDPFPHAVMRGAARNLSCTPSFLAPFAKGFPFSTVTHRAIYQCAKRIPPLRSG